MPLNNDDKEWIRAMIENSHSAAALKTRELIFKEAIPGHESTCRHWFAVKITAGVLAVVITFLGVGNIWGFSALLNAVNNMRTTASTAAAAAQNDAATAHKDAEPKP